MEYQGAVTADRHTQVFMHGLAFGAVGVCLTDNRRLQHLVGVGDK